MFVTFLCCIFQEIILVIDIQFWYLFFLLMLICSTQGTSGFGGQVGSTAPLHSTQPILNRYPAHTNQSSFPMGRGNPFG